jgi:hypothetical protein
MAICGHHILSSEGRQGADPGDFVQRIEGEVAFIW